MSRLFYVLMLMIACLPVHANEHILTPYLGLTNWSNDTGHTARGNPISFRDNTQFTFGFRYLYMFDSGVALGGDAYLYDKDPNNSAQAEDAGVAHFHALVEYFFNHKSDVSPFIGAGLGVSAIGFSGGLLDDDGTGGTSIELNAGVLFRLTERVGMQLEYKYTDFSLDEDIDGLYTNIDTNANSFLVGVTIHL